MCFILVYETILKLKIKKSKRVIVSRRKFIFVKIPSYYSTTVKELSISCRMDIVKQCITIIT